LVESVCSNVLLRLSTAPFAIISFPFLFSLMFGDAGHGLLMLAAAVWMVAAERKLLKSKSDNEVRKSLDGKRPNVLVISLL
jgi:V-type H+-transporting ATPase subunit a